MMFTGEHGFKLQGFENIDTDSIQGLTGNRSELGLN